MKLKITSENTKKGNFKLFTIDDNGKEQHGVVYPHVNLKNAIVELTLDIPGDEFSADSFIVYARKSLFRRIWDWIINRKSSLKVFEMRGQKRQLRPEKWVDEEDEGQGQRVTIDKGNVVIKR